MAANQKDAVERGAKGAKGAKSAAATAPDTTSKELEKKAPAGALMDMGSMMEDSGLGMENLDKDCFSIPFLCIIQSNSPQINPTEGAYIPDAKIGGIFNTVTQEYMNGNEGFIFVPCAFDRKFVEWVPREKGGGLFGSYLPSEAPAVVGKCPQTGKDLTEAGNHLMDTRYHFGLVVDIETGSWSMGLVACASTQIKKSRDLITCMDTRRVKDPASGALFRPPTFGQVFKFTTVPEKNAKGSWFGWKITSAGTIEGICSEGIVVNGELYQSGKQLHEMVISGKAKADEASMAAAGAAADDGAM